MASIHTGSGETGGTPRHLSRFTQEAVKKEENMAKHAADQADIQLAKLQRIAAAKAGPVAPAPGAAAPGALEATITAQRDKARALQASTTIQNPPCRPF